MTDSLLTEDLNTVDPTKDYLTELVGENKKFKTPQDLARGKQEADLYIETMKSRMDEMRADYLRVMEENKAKATLQELIDQHKRSLEQEPNRENPNASIVEKPGIDPKDLDSLLDTKIKAREAEIKRQENYDIVRKKLEERFGPNFQRSLKEQVRNLELDDDYVNELARRSPNAFFKTLGIDQEPRQSGFQAPPQSSQRSDSFAPKGGEKRTWSYYQNMKKTNPKLYLDPKTTVQMHNDAQLLGEAFKDGDFNS